MPTTDIGWAIRGLKLGLKVRRHGWQDNNEFLWYKPPAKIQAEWCKDPKLKKLAEDNGGVIDGRGTICHYLEVYGAPTILTGWLPTIGDLLADDWEGVEG
jgi:hypothetical protein